MKVGDSKYFAGYQAEIGQKIADWIAEFDFSEKPQNLDFLTKASAVYSSNIEGNTIDLNSFMNYELSKTKFKSAKEIAEIEDLVEAYKYAQKNDLTEENFLQVHRILSRTLLIKSKRGKYREESVGVFGKQGLIYLALEAEHVVPEMQEFFREISELLNRSLSASETFYHASLIHLKLAHIHPFMDGNGRIARLLEKWFIAEKLGKKFWQLPAEEFYKNNQEKYYQAINLGVNYYELDYDKCLDFLKLLPNCLKK